jgi:hypothetical protein
MCPKCGSRLVDGFVTVGLVFCLQCQMWVDPTDKHFHPESKIASLIWEPAITTFTSIGTVTATTTTT